MAEDNAAERNGDYIKIEIPSVIEEQMNAYASRLDTTENGTVISPRTLERPDPESDYFKTLQAADRETIYALLVKYAKTPSESNAEYMLIVRDYMIAKGVDPKDISIKRDRDTILDESLPKQYSLVAGIGDLANKEAIAFSNHSDVVEVDPDKDKTEKKQVWETGDGYHLYKQTQSNGDIKYIGRGAVDLQGNVAAVLDTIEDAVAAHKEGALENPMMFLMSSREEASVKGAQFATWHLMQFLETNEYKLPKVCYIVEPTDMQPVTAHKGKVAFAAHLDADDPSLIWDTLIEYLKIKDDLVSDPQYHDTRFNPANPTLNAVHAVAQSNESVDRQASNVIPNYAEFELNYVGNPTVGGDALDELLDIMNGVIIKDLKASMPSMYPDTNIEYHGMKVTVTGANAHTSQNDGVNALDYAARVIQYMRDEYPELIEVFEPQSPSTVPDQKISNGEKIDLVFEMRTAPTNDQEKEKLGKKYTKPERTHLMDKITQFLAERLPAERTAVENPISEIGRYPGLRILEYTFGKKKMPYIRDAEEFTGNPSTTAAYGTDGGWIQSLSRKLAKRFKLAGDKYEGIPCIIIGAGNISRAHKYNEYQMSAEVDAMQKFAHCAVATKSKARYSALLPRVASKVLALVH